MNEHLSIETPEQIKINYSIAGIGSRFYAALIDIAVMTLIAFIGAYVTIRAITGLDERLDNWLAAIAGVATFALLWGYYMVFELTTNGQSPGKRALGLRVIKVHGYPISFSDSAIRNLVRIVDFPSVLLRCRAARYVIKQELAAAGRLSCWDPRC